MQLYHFVLTLSGSSEPVTTTARLRGKAVTLQPGETNAGPVYVGGRNSAGAVTVSASNYGVRLPIAAAGVPPPPYPVGPDIVDHLVVLSDIRVIGTAGDKLFVSYWGEPL